MEIVCEKPGFLSLSLSLIQGHLLSHALKCCMDSTFPLVILLHVYIERQSHFHGIWGTAWSDCLYVAFRDTQIYIFRNHGKPFLSSPFESWLKFVKVVVILGFKKFQKHHRQVLWVFCFKIFLTYEVSNVFLQKFILGNFIRILSIYPN